MAHEFLFAGRATREGLFQLGYSSHINKSGFSNYWVSIMISIQAEAIYNGQKTTEQLNAH